MPNPDEEPEQVQREIHEIKEHLEKALDGIKQVEKQEQSAPSGPLHDSSSLPGDPTTSAPVNWSAPEDDEDD